jgi:ribosomal protein S18 acetylase RimI-like enzyme
MPHVLDNMIWNALITGNRDIAEVDREVGFYHPDIAPFAGLKELNTKNLDRLYAMVPSGRKLALHHSGELYLDAGKWASLHKMDVTQMVYEAPVASFTTGCSSMIVPLTKEHIPAMLELTALTKPGPFLENTILFGNYFGIFEDGRLAAMAGQRMHPVPYMEVSAVCTHPDFRGKGYAKAIMLRVMGLIIQNSFTPFLHVLSNNEGAIGLYESIGYRVRRRFFIEVVKRE